MARGLNGQTVFAAEDVHVGYVDGQDYGYRGLCPVTVDVRMERLDKRDAYETTGHRQVSRPLDFAMSVAVWQPDGREMIASSPAGEEILDAILAAAAYAPGWDAQKITSLKGLAGLHLNDMRAGCDHQEIVYEEDQYGRTVPSLTLTPICQHPRAVRLHPGKAEKDDDGPARAAGYRYGSAWLLRELPSGTLSTVRHLFAGSGKFDPGQAFTGAGITAQAVELDNPPAYGNDGRRGGQWWTVTLTNADGASLVVPFWQGSAYTEIHRGQRRAVPPDARTVLNCLISDAQGYENARDLSDWASEYGYDDPQQARQAYNLIGGQTAELRAFLGARYDAYARGEA